MLAVISADAPGFGNHFLCRPHTECVKSLAHRLKPGESCYFTNFVYLSKWNTPWYGGEGLTLVATQLGDQGEYAFSWRNDTDRVIEVHGFTALASYNCFTEGQ